MRPRRLLVPVGARGAVVALGALAACTSSDHYVLITVDSRPAVHDATSIAVTLANAGSSRTDNLVLRDRPFPVTFSVSAPGRSGELAISIDALDAAGLTVGHGSALTRIDAASASVMLDATDFVVNTDFAGDQFPSDDAQAGGFQVAALPDGTWTAVFRDGCTAGPCSVFARRFDRTGKPVSTAAAAGTNAFTVTARPTTGITIPAIASGQTATVAVWNFSDVGTSTASGVACRSLDAAGRLGADQVSVDTTAAGHVVSVAALPGDRFVAAWRIIDASAIDEIHAAILGPDCTPAGAVQLVARGAAVSDLLHRGQVAGSGSSVMFAWVTDGDAHVRAATGAGVFSTPDLVLVPQTPTDEVEAMRVVAAPGGGFVVGVRWAQKATGTGGGRIELYHLDAAAAQSGPPTAVTDQLASDFDTSGSFALASRPDGTVLVAWHACGALGDDSQCGVFGRFVRGTGSAAGDAFAIATTTPGDQQLPSVAALDDAFVAVWSDASMKPPDVSGRSVRARILYPPPGP